MNAKLMIAGATYSFDQTKPIDISIPLVFNASQPNAYGVAPANSEPCVVGEFVGDTRRGGSCNFEQYTFIPHCNGTHTECIGHITHERISIRESLQDAFVPATLITVDPAYARDTGDTYSITIDAEDRLITKAQLESAGLAGRAPGALIIRTLPNDDRKLTRQYVEYVPPYFTNDAMQYIAERDVRHLLVDLPSVDRLYDAGKLSNHRIFWRIDEGRFELTPTARKDCTITELIYVPNEVTDGSYLLNLQIAPFASDASPSRPILFRTAQN